MCIAEDRTILLRTGQSPKYLLDTLIHETLHALYPELTEEQVAFGSWDLTKVLGKLFDYTPNEMAETASRSKGSQRT